MSSQTGTSVLPSILFNISKKEGGNPNTTYKIITKKYKSFYKFQLNKDEITLDKLKQYNLVIFGSPREKFSKSEFDALKNYLEDGGNIMVMFQEGGETKFNTNLNYLLEQYGVSVNNDSVVRTAFYKYFHPKEVYVQAGILNQEVTRVAMGQAKESMKFKNKPGFISNYIAKEDDDLNRENEQSGLDFVYPFGSTLIVQEPSHSILGTGPLSYPANRPVASIYVGKNGKGKLAVTGSFEMFGEQYLKKEKNERLFEFFMKFFLSDECSFEFDKEEQLVSEYQYIPEINELAEKLKSCLQESEDLPRDFTTQFDQNLFKFDTNLIPEAIKLFEQLDVKHETLTLIPPNFETPLLGLVPAVFPPILRELPSPNLELFDLEDEFAQEKVKLAQVTNKCNNEDLDYYVKECGDILGVGESNDAKSIIRHVLDQLVNFKKLNQM